MNGKLLRELIKQIRGMKTDEEMREFIYGLLTPQELVEIPQRLEIVRLLKKGMAQHEIAKQLGVGVATVTRGSKELQKGRFKQV